MSNDQKQPAFKPNSLLVSTVLGVAALYCLRMLTRGILQGVDTPPIPGLGRVPLDRGWAPFLIALGVALIPQAWSAFKAWRASSPTLTNRQLLEKIAAYLQQLLGDAPSTSSQTSAPAAPPTPPAQPPVAPVIPAALAAAPAPANEVHA